MVSVPARRQQVAYGRGRGLSARRACTLFSVARSALEYRNRKAAKDAPVVTRMKELSAQYPRYGYRRIAESFNGKFRDECLSLEWFRSRAEAKVLIEEWRRHFNEVRPHSSLGYLAPNEFVARGTRPAPRHATGRDATVYGASAPRPVAQPSPRGQMQRAREAVSS